MYKIILILALILKYYIEQLTQWIQWKIIIHYSHKYYNINIFALIVIEIICLPYTFLIKHIYNLKCEC